MFLCVSINVFVIIQHRNTVQTGLESVESPFRFHHISRSYVTYIQSYEPRKTSWDTFHLPATGQWTLRKRLMTDPSCQKPEIRSVATQIRIVYKKVMRITFIYCFIYTFCYFCEAKTLVSPFQAPKQFVHMSKAMFSQALWRTSETRFRFFSLQAQLSLYTALQVKRA